MRVLAAEDRRRRIREVDDSIALRGRPRRHGIRFARYAVRSANATSWMRPTVGTGDAPRMPERPAGMSITVNSVV